MNNRVAALVAVVLALQAVTILITSVRNILMPNPTVKDLLDEIKGNVNNLTVSMDAAFRRLDAKLVAGEPIQAADYQEAREINDALRAATTEADTEAPDDAAPAV